MSREMTDLTNRHFSRQSHIITNSRFALTRAEIDIVLVLLSAIHKEDKDFKDYEFTIKELEEKTDRSWNSQQLKAVVKSIMSKPLELPMDKGSWRIVNWFSNFEYHSTGVISCCFDKRLKPYLIDLKGRFVLSDIRHLLPMNSSYSKRIYLLLKERYAFGTRVFKVEDLMDILKVPASLRRYDNFKRKVLKRAEEDINLHTDLLVKFTEKKLGRKVVQITWDIRSNKNEFQVFKSHIRDNHANETLLIIEQGTLACSGKGLLYYKDNIDKHINKESALVLWHMLFGNRENLIIFQKSLLDILDEDAAKELQLDVMGQNILSRELPDPVISEYDFDRKKYALKGEEDELFYFLDRDALQLIELYAKDKKELYIKYPLTDKSIIMTDEDKARKRLEKYFKMWEKKATQI